MALKVSLDCERTVALNVACCRNVSVNATQSSNILTYMAAEILSNES